jgi:hypothetical protein
MVLGDCLALLTAPVVVRAVRLSLPIATCAQGSLFRSSPVAL